MSVVLSCSNLSVSFGAFSALSGISLGFEEGRTTGLIGPNGAGKTTFLNALTGLQRATSGAIVLNGRDITGLPAHRRARIGMARSFQIVTVFPQMTVLENVQVARMRAHMKVAVPWRTIASFPEVGREALATIDRFGLSDVADVPAGTLSHGRQRALELAIVLVNEPRVLLLDEPLAGVGRAELDHFAGLVREVSARQTTIVVEHNMDVLMEMARDIVVLVGGQVLARGTPEAIQSDPKVRDAYLGA
ncbi:branched-chain amino acid transport system ATP-binding protein [Amorphus suaedae]